jgi:Helix-turn-helix of DDE superfamily endonuclease
VGAPGVGGTIATPVQGPTRVRGHFPPADSPSLRDVSLPDDRPVRTVFDHRWVQVFSASRPELIHPFTGLRPAQFHRLVRLVARRGGDTITDGRPGRPWALTLPDRVLLVAVYWRTNLTMRQIGPLFEVSHSAAHRAIDTLGPLLALAPVRRRPKDQVTIVDGTVIPPGITGSPPGARTTATRPICKSPSTRTPGWSSLWAIRNPVTATTPSSTAPAASTSNWPAVR